MVGEVLAGRQAGVWQRGNAAGLCLEGYAARTVLLDDSLDSPGSHARGSHCTNHDRGVKALLGVQLVGPSCEVPQGLSGGARHGECRYVRELPDKRMHACTSFLVVGIVGVLD